MKTLKIEPDGWPCSYAEAPPGFILCKGQLCFKSQYRTSTGKIEGYNSAGEFLCIDEEDIVQPVDAVWYED